MPDLSREQVQVLRAGLAAGEFPLTEEAVAELLAALDAAIERAERLAEAGRRAAAKAKIEYDRLGGSAAPDECWAEIEALWAVLDEYHGERA